MIKFIGSTNNTTYPLADFQTFVDWEEKQSEWQLDIETNVVDQLPQRKLKTIQFGNIEIQWVLQWEYLTLGQQVVVKDILQNKEKIKYIHYAMFEYTVLAKYNIIIDNVICTLLQEKILHTGLDTAPGYYSLQQLVSRYLGIDMSKDEQTTFDVDYLTNNQIEYAAFDVTPLQQINEIQVERLELNNLMMVRDLENQSTCAFGDITVNGMLLDQDAWRANYDWAQAETNKDEAILNSYIRGSLRRQALWLGYLKDQDTLEINWASPKQRKVIFSYLFPKLEGVTKPIIKKYADKHQVEPLWDYLEGDFVYLEHVLTEHHRDFLIGNEFMIPAGTITINWASPDQRLKFFKTVEPKLKSTSKEALALTTHPMIKEYKNYIDTSKLVTSFGEEFINKHVDIDGYVRTNFNQILNTGRVSSSRPNMQQIPAKESVGNRYRNCFIAPKDWVYVSSDFNSQELVVIATLSQDPVWLAALKNGEDLHSICAELVFGLKWKAAAGSGCQYYIDKQKCKCPGHKQMRTSVKTVNFGLAYGMSAHKLSTTIQVSKKDAQELINKYFTVFPKIKSKLDALGMFGMVKGYILTPAPFYRRRWFERGPSDTKQVLDHMSGEYYPALGIIERASKNTPIQGGSGDMTKLALVYIRDYINDNNLRDKVKLVMQVHDQVDTICHKDYADVWQNKMTELMERAAKVVIPSGLLTSETNITEKWTK